MGQKEGGDGGSGGGKDGGKPVVVMKMEIHCESCAKKVKSLLKKSTGVEDVEVDVASNKVTVTGKVDPAKLREKLESKTHKSVGLVSPLPAAPKKDGGVSEKKPEEKNPVPKESTVVLKITLHCDGCAKKIKRIISKIKGVSSVTIDSTKDLVTVTGIMEVNDLVPYLQVKCKRTVEAVLPKKDGGGGSGDKKDNKKAPATAGAAAPGGSSGEKKKEEGKNGDDAGKKEEKNKEGGGQGNGPMQSKVELQRMEYYAQPYQQTMVPMPPPPQYATSHWQYGPPPHGDQFWNAEPYAYSGGYPVAHYMSEGFVMDQRVHAPQMFSDENPNACSIM
ncbi:hypothetical protein MLD38_021578 [Melastoma candidum]|uniref:Uncharacterized protein n=1 Tax=Melastoma candidum TaxID=119954 RepID=A0ACB9QGQ7_9MYRT|nr:hypothetical protein MLD38_021578 [Melastoma candidum]